MPPRAALLLFALLAPGCGAPPDGPPGAAHLAPGDPPEKLIGQLVPPFEMTDLDGDTITRDGLKGKVVLIEFWATWCVPCRITAPVLQALQNRHADRGLVVIGANTGERDGSPARTRDRLAAFAARRAQTYTLTYGNEEFQRACGVDSLPTMILLDRQGVVRAVFTGYSRELPGKLDQAVQPLLDQR
jgi:thiol-disulfide isomerase/thioredoxin